MTSTVTATELAAASTSATSAVERAFVLLQAVVGAGSPIGVRELARRTGLPRSTTARLASTLVDIAMIEKAADGSLVPGAALATISVDGGPAPLLRDRLRPLLAALAEHLDESVAMAVDDGDAVLYLAQIEAVSPVRARSVEAERHPFHVVAHGLVLMAHWPAERLERYLAAPLAASTSNSVTDPDVIRARLERIRVEGYAWTEEEFDLDINGLAVAVPVPTDGASTVSDAPSAAIGYYGPTYRLSPNRQPSLASDILTIVESRGGAMSGTIC